MSTLLALADWVASLNPYALAALTCGLLLVVWLVLLALWFLFLAIASGAGETNDGEADGETEPTTETHAPDSTCLRSVCAWCEPGAKGDNLTHGICPAHKEQVLKEAGL